MFHRSYPEIKISPSTLRKVYIAHRIRYKQIKRVKPVMDLLHGRSRSLALSMLQALDEARSSKLKIIFVDEAVFTFNTFQGRAWAHSGLNVQVPEKSLSMPTWAIVTGVSESKGLELSICHPRSIKAV